MYYIDPHDVLLQNIKNLAGDEAIRLNHDFVDTEHILLAILKPPQEAARDLLVKLHCPPESLEHIIRKMAPAGADMVTMGRHPFRPNAKKVFEYAYLESIRFLSKSIGVEHLLLGLLREKEGIAARALARQEVTLEAVRALIPKPASPAIQNGIPPENTVEFWTLALKVALREPEMGDIEAIQYAIALVNGLIP